MREACASSGDDGGWADVGLGAPSTKFACCSWWPDVGAIGYADGARSDQRWIEGTSVGDALETMAAKASKCTRDTDDEDDELTATTPAEAAARALELIVAFTLVILLEAVCGVFSRHWLGDYVLTQNNMASPQVTSSSVPTSPSRPQPHSEPHAVVHPSPSLAFGQDPAHSNPWTRRLV